MTPFTKLQEWFFKQNGVTVSSEPGLTHSHSSLGHNIDGPLVSCEALNSSCVQDVHLPVEKSGTDRCYHFIHLKLAKATNLPRFDTAKSSLHTSPKFSAGVSGLTRPIWCHTVETTNHQFHLIQPRFAWVRTCPRHWLVDSRRGHGHHFVSFVAPHPAETAVATPRCAASARKPAQDSRKSLVVLGFAVHQPSIN